MVNDIERVEAMIREGVAKAQAAGRKIVRGKFGLCSVDGKWTLADCCCLLAPIVDGEESIYEDGGERDEEFAIGSNLKIASDYVTSIIMGFDGQEPDRWVDPDFHALGYRLGREFVDGVKP